MIIIGILLLVFGIPALYKAKKVGLYTIMPVLAGVMLTIGGLVEILDPETENIDNENSTSAVSQDNIDPTSSTNINEGNMVSRQQDSVTIPVYKDPKGYFSITPPSKWNKQKYPDDPRGKVAFYEPRNQAELRVLAKAIDTPDYDALIKELREIETKLGVPMNIEPIVFNGKPAIKRTAIVTMQGVPQKLLLIDLLIDGVSHNLQYGASSGLYDTHFDIAWQSMLTYEPITQSESSTPEEVRKHETAKWIRLTKIALSMGNMQAAKETVSAGLKVDPENIELLQLKGQIDGERKDSEPVG